MKKYIPPLSEEICLQGNGCLLGGSLTGDGSENTGRSPDETGYNGVFRMEHRGWSSENWSDEES